MPGAWIAAGSVASGLIGAVGSNMAAGQAAAASKYAANLQQNNWAFTQGNLAQMYTPAVSAEDTLSNELQPGAFLNQTYQYTPYGGAGVPTAPRIGRYRGPGIPTAPTIAPYGGPGVPTAPTISAYGGPTIASLGPVPTAPTLQQFDPSMATLQNLPGYQFELQQGELATREAAAAQGRGVSGAAMEQAGQFAQGLASTDLNTYYNQWMGNQNLLLQGYGAQLSGYQTGLGAQQQNYNQWLSGNQLNLQQYQQALAGQAQGFSQWQGQGQMTLAQYQQALAAQAQGFGQWQGQGQMTLAQYQEALAGQAQNYQQWQTGQTTAQQIMAANQLNQYNMLLGNATLGANAMAGAATNTATMSANIAQSLQSAGAAQAAGTLGGANALSQGINAATSPYFGTNAQGQSGMQPAPISNLGIGSAIGGAWNWLTGANPGVTGGAGTTTQPFGAGSSQSNLGEFGPSIAYGQGVPTDTTG